MGEGQELVGAGLSRLDCATFCLHWCIQSARRAVRHSGAGSGERPKCKTDDETMAPQNDEWKSKCEELICSLSFNDK